MEHKFRALAMIAVGREIERTIARHTSKDEDGIVPSCISCEHFRESTEECLPAGARPPARIIAFGCNLYRDKNDIPF